MTFSEFMTATRNTFKEDLNTFLTAKGLSSVRVLSSGLQIDRKKLSIAVFPTATNGSTFEQQNSTDVVRFTVMLYCNGDATENGLTQGEEYYSAVLEFIQSRTFGESSNLDESVLCRMDEGEPVNGAVFLISSRISSNTDFGWD